MFQFAASGRAVAVWLLGAACLLPFEVSAERASGAIDLNTFGRLPEDFEAHFFDVPLAVRVELDQRYLGDAMVVLSRDNRVQLLAFTDTEQSAEPATLRQLWQQRLEGGRMLGDCLQNCPDGLQAIHYSLANSQLSLLTSNAEKLEQDTLFHRLPEQSDAGLLLRNQLNLVNDGNQTTGRIGLLGQGNLHNWTTLADARVDRSPSDQGDMRYRMNQLYAESMHEAHFFRLGYFSTGAEGLVRQPTLLGRRPDSTLGLMLGSSDSLLVDNGQASAIPVDVTPNRPGIVEIYRNGSLINSQPVQPGLQALDTRVLPGGIYDVELRLLEDGLETSRSEVSIYKPSRWQNMDNRWRYDLYLGQQVELLSNGDGDREQSPVFGALSNYLMHPAAVLGLSLQQVDADLQMGTSLDWDVHERFKLYASLNQTQGLGNGGDLQLTYTHPWGSLLLSHNQTWLEPGSSGRDDTSQRQVRSRTAFSINQRITARSSATLRLEHSAGSASGLGADLSWAFYGKLRGHQSSVRLSLFDRPGTRSSAGVRSRGVNVAVSMKLERDGRQLGVDVGSRASREGGNDPYASLWYRQNVDLGPVHSLGGSATLDGYGTSLAANGRFHSQALQGDAYAQSSSFNNNLSGGLNLESTLALGDGKLAMGGSSLPFEAGLIIDVESDLHGVKLRANDGQGMSAVLHPGRNIVPVTAFKSGHVRFDFDTKDVPPAQIQPLAVDYHLNRGGVGYHSVKVMRTVTVFGRLLDGQGQPLHGAHVVNDAGRTVVEVDGYFNVEMSESRPTLEIRHGTAGNCLLTLPPDNFDREDDLLIVGDQRCVPSVG
ncbi:MAG: CS1-pili formation C-terminal domain-containing protein [Pseudomonas alloputida]